MLRNETINNNHKQKWYFKSELFLGVNCPVNCISQDDVHHKKGQDQLHIRNCTSLLMFRCQSEQVLLSAGCEVVSIMLVNARRRRTNSLLFDLGGRLIGKLCHIVASHFPPRSPKQLVTLLGEGSTTYCRDRAWMHRQITAFKHSGCCVSCEIKLAGSFHRWTQLVLVACLFSFFRDSPGFLSKQAVCKCPTADITNIFLIIGRTGGPSCGMMGRPWRLSALRGCQWLTLPQAGCL